MSTLFSGTVNFCMELVQNERIHASLQQRKYVACQVL